MAAEKDKAIDYSKIAEALNKLAETPNPKSKTLADHLREPSVKEAIERAKAAGYRSDAIVPLLADLGIKTTTASFDATWSKLKREERGDTGVKADTKSRSTSKKASTPKPDQAVSEKPSETKPSEGTKSGGAGGGKAESKSLNKSPNMGGAFNENDL